MKNISLFIIIILVFGFSCKSSKLQELPPEKYSINEKGYGQVISIEFIKGEAHNHPLMAIWVEDLEGSYIQTLYVARSVATGVFGHGEASTGVWQPGELRRPASLPVWAHSRGIAAEDGLFVPDSGTAVPDAYSGATPWGNFILSTHLNKEQKEKFRLRFEINQTWDWNEFWHNNKYPDNEAYQTSCQPALVYECIINPDAGSRSYPMEIVGHSHYAGEDGEIYPDISTLSTALQIVEEIEVKIE